MRFESTEGGAVVDTFEGDEGGEDENKGKEKSEDEDGVEEGSIGNVASCDLDLHQVNKPIVARYRDASHARREVKLHRRLCCRTTTRSLPPTTTLQPPETIFITHVPTIIRSTIFLLQGGSPPPTTPHWSFQPIGYRSLAQRFQLSSGF